LIEIVSLTVSRNCTPPHNRPCLKKNAVTFSLLCSLGGIRPRKSTPECLWRLKPCKRSIRQDFRPAIACRISGLTLKKGPRVSGPHVRAHQQGRWQMRHITKKVHLNLVTVVAIAFLCSATVAQAQQDLTFGSWSLGNPAPGHMLATHCTLL